MGEPRYIYAPRLPSHKPVLFVGFLTLRIPVPVLADIGIILLLLFLNGVFAMSELAIVSARPTRLRQMIEEKKRGAALALELAEDPTAFLAIVQIGLTLFSVMAGAYS